MKNYFHSNDFLTIIRLFVFTRLYLFHCIFFVQNFLSEYYKNYCDVNSLVFRYFPVSRFFSPVFNNGLKMKGNIPDQGISRLIQRKTQSGRELPGGERERGTNPVRICVNSLQL